MTPEQFELVETLFGEACALTPRARAGFLDERCTDPLVRAEVDQMLAIDERSGAGFSALSPPPAPSLTRIDEEDALLRSQSIPERIGRYRILRECGHGGMGIVYEAEQESPQRKVALKVIRTGIVSGQLLRRFKNEAEILGRLQHPGIAQIFEAGSFKVGDGGQPYFAMEFVEGSDLLAYAKTHQLNTRDRLALFARICDAVHYAHQKGVIHRDLKPDNILIVPPENESSADQRHATSGGFADDVGQPKILDFGVARMTDSDVQMTTMQTDIGQLIGTIQYMSPEQTSGDSRELDVRSDVYALGVVLFELLSELTPYDLRNHSIPESVLVIRDEEPRRLSSIDTAFRGDVETIVGKCLEKEPERRYAFAAELAEDIRRHLSDQPIAARPPSTWYQVRKFSRRNRALVGGTLTTIVALVIGLIASTTFAFRASENAERALISEAAALREAYVARLTAATALVDSDPLRAGELLEAAQEAQRGWEWRHLNSRLQRHARTYEADAASVGPIALVRGGTQLVSALVDGRVAVWDLESAELIHIGTELAGSNIRALDVPLDGPPLVACGTRDGRVRVWDLDKDRWFDIATKDGPIREVTWDRTGARLLFSTESGIHLWRQGHPIRDHAFEVHAYGTPPVRLAFSRDEERFTISTLSSNAGEIFWWNAGTGERVGPEPGNLRPLVRAWGVSNDSTRFAVAGGDGVRSCVLQDARTGKVQHVLRGHNNFVAVVKWTPDDTRLLTSGSDRTIRLWDTATGAALAVLGSDPLTPLAVTPDGSGVAFRADGKLHYWDFTLSSSTVLQPDVSFVYYLGYAPDGTRLAASSSHSMHATLMDPLAGRVVRTIDTGKLSYGVVFSADGARFNLGRVTIDVATGAVAPLIETPVTEWLKPDRWSARYAPGMTLNANGTRLATAGHGNKRANAIVRDVATGEIVFEVEGDFWSVALSPDGTLLAAGHGGPGHIEIWSLAEKRKLVDLPPHGTQTYGVDFHPDGTRLATGGNDNAIRLWDTTTWEPVLELRGHTSYVKTVVFSPDGTQLASGSGDLTVRIWDTIPRAERHRQAVAGSGGDVAVGPPRSRQ
jgi:serine/threonine protein kinase/WD40 repeat protein